MSGGRFDYDNDRAANTIFGWDICTDYGLGKYDYNSNVKAARKRNPLEDKQMSELVYDVFCILHSLDWYLSGDTGEDDYREDVKYFKNKWFYKNENSQIREEIDKGIEELRDDLYQTFCLDHTKEDGA